MVIELILLVCYTKIFIISVIGFIASYYNNAPFYLCDINSSMFILIIVQILLQIFARKICFIKIHKLMPRCYMLEAIS